MTTELTDNVTAQTKNILREVCEEYGVHPDDILKKDTGKIFVLVRRHAYQRLKLELGLSAKQIGKLCDRSEDAVRQSLMAARGKLRKRAPRAAKVQPEVQYTRIEAWISVEDEKRLTKLAQRNNVTVSDMVRGVVVDAICEEFP